jgi:hypothetical protein
MDNPADRFTSEGFGYGTDNSDKGVGKSFSYAVKYALLKTFMIESGDDEEDRQPEEKPEYKPVNYKVRDANILAIKGELTRATTGMGDAEKMKFMVEKLKVASFKDLEKKPVEELEKSLALLRSLTIKTTEIPF